MLPVSGHLLVANANKHSSKLIEYGACSTSSASRAYRSVAVGSGGDLVHPYGLMASGTSVFTSNRDTSSVVEYTGSGWSAHSFARYRSSSDVRGLAADGNYGEYGEHCSLQQVQYAQ